jgi:hypothetical protein
VCLAGRVLSLQEPHTTQVSAASRHPCLDIRWRGSDPFGRRAVNLTVAIADLIQVVLGRSVWLSPDSLKATVVAPTGIRLNVSATCPKIGRIETVTSRKHLPNLFDGPYFVGTGGLGARTDADDVSMRMLFGRTDDSITCHSAYLSRLSGANEIERSAVPRRCPVSGLGEEPRQGSTRQSGASDMSGGGLPRRGLD